jgi:hypothetical protein
MDEERRRSRKIMDELTVGERWMLLFGKGRVVGPPWRVVWIEKTERVEG